MKKDTPLGDTQKAGSETPRTDALATASPDVCGLREMATQYNVMLAHARHLERELQAALMVQGSTLVEDTGELVRYGIRWRGPREPIADSTLPGGYWTPWHIAQNALTAARRAGMEEAEWIARKSDEVNAVFRAWLSNDAGSLDVTAIMRHHWPTIYAAIRSSMGGNTSEGDV